MTVKQLIKKLKTFDQEKIVILTEPDLIGWDNIGEVTETNYDDGGNCMTTSLKKTKQRMKATENFDYTETIKYLETKKTPQAEQLIEKLKTFKTNQEFLDWRFYTLCDALLSVS